jgi:hypothetical protein
MTDYKKTLSEQTKIFEEKGYTKRFTLTEKALECLDTGKSYNPAEFSIVETFRFDGMTSVGDEAVLYLIEADEGQTKGMLIDAYGTYADSISFEMAQKLRFTPTT